MGNKAAVNRLDEESGIKTVAKMETGTPVVTEVPVDIWWAVGDSNPGPAD